MKDNDMETKIDSRVSSLFLYYSPLRVIASPRHRVVTFLAGLFTVTIFSLLLASSVSEAANAAAPAKTVTVTPKPAPVQVAQGSPATGEQLFAGLIPFAKGGPPCISCHSVSGIPFPGGGTLGPDLTGVYSKFGPTAMVPTLATLPFPTMKPIFDNRPLTPEEQQNLGAFFEKAGKASLAPIISRTWEIALAGLGGLIVLLILGSVIWSDRLLTVRRSMVERAIKAGGASS